MKQSKIIEILSKGGSIEEKEINYTTRISVCSSLGEFVERINQNQLDALFKRGLLFIESSSEKDMALGTNKTTSVKTLIYKFSKT